MGIKPVSRYNKTLSRVKVYTKSRQTAKKNEKRAGKTIFEGLRNSHVSLLVKCKEGKLPEREREREREHTTSTRCLRDDEFADDENSSEQFFFFFPFYLNA